MIQWKRHQTCFMGFASVFEEVKVKYRAMFLSMAVKGLCFRFELQTTKGLKSTRISRSDSCPRSKNLFYYLRNCGRQTLQKLSYFSKRMSRCDMSICSKRFFFVVYGSNTDKLYMFLQIKIWRIQTLNALTQSMSFQKYYCILQQATNNFANNKYQSMRQYNKFSRISKYIFNEHTRRPIGRWYYFNTMFSIKSNYFHIIRNLTPHHQFQGIKKQNSMRF